MNDNICIGAAGDIADFQFLEEIIKQKQIEEECRYTKPLAGSNTREVMGSTSGLDVFYIRIRWVQYKDEIVWPKDKKKLKLNKKKSKQNF